MTATRTQAKNRLHALRSKSTTLVGFAKTAELEPGASQDVTVAIDPAASHHPLCVRDKASKAWGAPSGSYTVLVGNSSPPEDLATAGTFTR